MSIFYSFQQAVSAKLDELTKLPHLFVTNVDKEEMKSLYLSSFPEGTNPIFRERTEHDCNCCHNFIRNVGAVVGIVDGELVSIWDIEIDNFYQDVADALSAYVKSKAIANILLLEQSKIGTKQNTDNYNSDITWKHFYYEFPSKFVAKKNCIPTKLGDVRTNFEVLQRGLTELTKDSLDTILELISQNSLYRGEEHKAAVVEFTKLKREFDALSGDADTHLWEKSLKVGGLSRFRNSVIGTLAVDLSNGEDLETAVSSFEKKVAPENYKRSSAVVTKGMIGQAEKKVMELGIADALQRRYAVMDDITINNVLFADRSIKPALGGGSIFDDLKKSAASKLPNMDKVEEISIDKFIKDVLPLASNIEVLLENKHKNNFVSLIAPCNKEAKGMFKWGNNFSWSYAGEVADSLMKENVKKAGGCVEGDLRFSIQWNDQEDNRDDLDAHCIQPGGMERIYFPNKGSRHRSSGMLDVDIRTPRGVAVENIVFSDKLKMPKGKYQFLVNCYSSRRGRNFSAEIEMGGEIFEYHFRGSMKVGQNIVVATVSCDGKGGLTIEHHLESSSVSKDIWGVTTNSFQEVEMIMNSPNHWDGEETGNKHWFFMLKDCKNPDKARGFYNEFLNNDLMPHRKVFEVLSSKMKTEESDNQLSGVGFSSTQRNEVVVKVSGSFTRMLKVKF